MMNRQRQWTRRQFSQLLAAATTSSLLAGSLPAAAFTGRSSHAFVGSFADGAIRVYDTSGPAWRQIHAVDAPSPAHLLMHPAVPVLYVVHDVKMWKHRPRGAVSAYRFDAAAGRLSHLETQPLSLSAINPRHAAVTAAGDALFVAAEGGGIYNVLPIGLHGRLQPVSAVRKELGLQEDGREKTAAPQRVALHDGSIYAFDPGQETVSRFAVDRDAITLLGRSRIDLATGACDMDLPAGLRKPRADDAEDAADSVLLYSA